MGENIIFLKYWYFTLAAVFLFIGIIAWMILGRWRAKKMKITNRQVDVVIVGKQKYEPKTISLDEIRDWQSIRPRSIHGKKVLVLEEIPLPLQGDLIPSVESAEEEPVPVAVGAPVDIDTDGNGKKDILAILSSEEEPITTKKRNKTNGRKKSRKKKHANSERS